MILIFIYSFCYSIALWVFYCRELMINMTNQQKLNVYQKGFTNLQEKTLSWVYIKQPIFPLLLLFVSCKNVQVNFTFSMLQFCLGVKSVRESVLLSGHWAECTASVIKEPRGSDHKVSITRHCLCGTWGFGGYPA